MTLSTTKSTIIYDQTNDLVEVFSNLRLINKVNNIEYEEQMVAWDSGEEELEEE